MTVQLNCSEKTKSICDALIAKLQLPDTYQQTIRDIILPIVPVLLSKKLTKPLFVSINGAQGTGKSTFTEFLKNILESEYNCRVAAFSIDDFYKTRAEREVMAKEIHPLFITRGVPGTHDLGLLKNAIQSLLNSETCVIPRFDKAKDDRHSARHSSQYNKPVDIILFEGWCNNSPVQTLDQLEMPVNQLESQEDTEGVWRIHSNEQLQAYHDSVFKHADVTIMLQAPGFSHIFEWRQLQENKLNKNSTVKNAAVMDDNKLQYFIQHYERITRHTLKYLPAEADIVLPVDEDHVITEIISKL